MVAGNGNAAMVRPEPNRAACGFPLLAPAPFQRLRGTKEAVEWRRSKGPWPGDGGGPAI